MKKIKKNIGQNQKNGVSQQHYEADKELVAKTGATFCVKVRKHYKRSFSFYCYSSLYLMCCGELHYIHDLVRFSCFFLQYLGYEEVKEARGVKVCSAAVAKLIKDKKNVGCIIVPNFNTF